MEFLSRLKDFCHTQGCAQTYWIGYSGGLDSHVLLHALASLRSSLPLQLRAVHVNHGLSQNAVAWAAHCANVCHALNIDCIVRSVEIVSHPEKSPEELARDYRYAVFAELLSQDDLLLTAHHQDDQAETVLLQLLRGAGPKGLAAMPKVKSFSQGRHARPFLDLTREELKTYAQHHQLRWIEDESNHNTHFTRNFLRHELIPLLKKRWPSVTATLSRVAENCADTQRMLDQVMAIDLDSMSTSKTLSVEKLKQLDAVRQRHVVRAWLSQNQYPLPSAVKLQQLLQDMLYARDDKTPHIAWQNVELRRYRGELYVMTSLIPIDMQNSWEWDMIQSCQLPHGKLTAVRGSQGLRDDIEKVSVRFRQGGEKIKLSGQKHRHTLKNLFQEWGVLPWERDRIPLIYVGNELAAVVGYAIAEDFRAKDQGYLIAFRPAQ